MRSGHALHKLFRFQAVVNQVADGNNLEVELLGDFLELRHTGHRAVFVHDFDESGSRAETGKLGEVHCGFGVACTAQNAFFLGVKRRNVTRTAKVRRLGIRIGESLDRCGTVVGRNTRSAAFELIDHDGERSAEHGSVFGSLAREIQFAAARNRKRAAKHATPLVEHEVHLFGSNLFGGDNEIALIFTVFVINHDQELAVLEIFNGLFNRIKQGHVPLDSFQYICRAYRLPHSPRCQAPSS